MGTSLVQIAPVVVSLSSTSTRGLPSGTAGGTAVIVSEFGEVGIDDAILSDAGDGIVELQNGCICCRLGSSLEQSLRDLFMARLRGQVRPFDRLLIETSGMTDPIDMIASMHARPVREMRYRMLGTITAFDSQFGLDDARTHPEAGAQLAAADCIILTKCDIAGTACDGADAVAALNPATPVLHSERGLAADAAPALEAAAGRLAATPSASAFRAVAAEAPAGGARHAGVRAMSLTLRDPVDWERFAAAVAGIATEGDARLLRLKGILSVAGIDRPLAVHGVRDVLYPPVRLQTDPLPPGESRVVLIYQTPAGADFEATARAALAASAPTEPTKGGAGVA